LCIGLPPLDYERHSLVLCIFQCGYEVLCCLACFGICRLQIHRIAPCLFRFRHKEDSGGLPDEKKRLLARIIQRG
jgi:hypothetical protein